jgi:hypothetical protein
MRNTLSSGIPTAFAALRAVSSKGVHVINALALEDLSWNSSSDEEYMAFAGVTMPERRWIANADII